MKTILELLTGSPFFESFDPRHLERLAAHAKLMSFHKGDVLFREHDAAEALYMLVVGKIELFFDGQPGSPSHATVPPRVLVRTLGEPGRVIGWSAMVEPYHYRASARALSDTQMLILDREWLEGFVAEEPEFGVELMERILWVMGNRVRECRIRLVAQRYEQEVLAIRALLDQSADQLAVTSPLHKIPFYLENRLTISDAFHTLELLQAHGDDLERSLAGLCLDILKNVRRELAIFQSLQAIYEHVAHAPHTAGPASVRDQCSQEFERLFKHVDYIIRGEEHLPDEPGHVFIMNHLANHPENTLPNEFQLTLDTHFVSAMLLYGKYGTSPIRVIRKSRPDEFGHQQYYDRLGYIYVYAGHVDEEGENPQLLAEKRRRYFLDVARGYLLDRKNIVICPEGTSTSTELSPVAFKAGAFRLAAFVRPEPLIVPIAVANFDKKLTRTRVAAVVHEPFRLSDVVGDNADDKAFFQAVNDCQRKFQTWVREAVALADTHAPA